jgi:hypothetical protein
MPNLSPHWLWPSIGKDLFEEHLIAVCRRPTNLSDRVLCSGGCCKSRDVENVVVNTVINLSRRDADISANRISRLREAMWQPNAHIPLTLSVVA